MNIFLAAHILHHYLKAGGKNTSYHHDQHFFQFWHTQMDLQDSYSPATLLHHLTMKAAHRAWFRNLLKTKLLENTRAALRIHPG